jgi:hypothetical protein
LFFHLNHSQRGITYQKGGLYAKNVRCPFRNQESVVDGVI